MIRPEYRGDRWLAKGRWAYVWRAAGFFTVLMMAFWLIGAGFVHLGSDHPAWNWLLPNWYPITVRTFLERMAVSAVSGLLFGWFMSYERRSRTV